MIFIFIFQSWVKNSHVEQTTHWRVITLLVNTSINSWRSQQINRRLFLLSCTLSLRFPYFSFRISILLLNILILFSCCFIRFTAAMFGHMLQQFHEGFKLLIAFFLNLILMFCDNMFFFYKCFLFSNIITFRTTEHHLFSFIFWYNMFICTRHFLGFFLFVVNNGSFFFFSLTRAELLDSDISLQGSFKSLFCLWCFWYLPLDILLCVTWLLKLFLKVPYCMFHFFSADDFSIIIFSSICFPVVILPYVYKDTNSFPQKYDSFLE